MLTPDMQITFAREALKEAREAPDPETRMEKLMEALGRVLDLLARQQPLFPGKPQERR